MADHASARPLQVSDPALSRSGPHWLTASALAIYLAGVWLLTHRYGGIWHDGVFYAGQAIARLLPETFRNDLFFAYGSQDSYTSFTGLYAWLIPRVGLADATLALVVAAHALWALTAVLLCRRAFQGPAFWMALALLFAMPRYYGTEQLVGYAEPFLTARSWAEPFALLSVLSLLHRKPLLAASACAASAVCHPIMALPACLLALFVLVRRRSLLAALTVAAGTGTALILLEVPPFPSLMAAMDGEWYRISVTRSPFVFVDQWALTDFGEPLFFASVLLIAMLERDAPLRPLWRAAFLTGCVGMAIAWIGALSHNVLLVQMQAWRSIWLVKVIAIIALAWLFERRWQRSSVDRAILLGLAASWLTVGTLGGFAAALLAVVSLVHHRHHRPLTLSPALARLGGFALLVIAIEATLSFGQQFWLHADLSLADRQLSHARGARSILAFLDSTGWLLHPLTLLALWRLALRGPRAAVVSLIAATALLAFSMVNWKQDRRQDQQIYARHSMQQPPLADLIPGGAVVYWENAFEYSWFLLRRANYASTHQSAGAIFSRETAVESERRLARLEKIGVYDSRLAWKAPVAPIRRSPTLDGLVYLCEDPLLGFVVLQADLDGRWTRAYDDPFTGLRYHVYRCADLRNKAGAREPF